MTQGRRFVIGGDFNASVRFDDFYRAGSRGSAFTKWFLKAKDAKWRAAHPKFHAGEQRRYASINDVPIQEVDRKYHWQLDRPRPADHPGLSDLDL